MSYSSLICQGALLISTALAQTFSGHGWNFGDSKYIIHIILYFKGRQFETEKINVLRIETKKLRKFIWEYISRGEGQQLP